MRGYTIGLIATFAFVVRSVEAQAPDFGSCPVLFRTTTCRALILATSRRIVECIGGILLFAPQTDGGDGGGGDGGDGGGGGGDGSGSDGSEGDSGGDGAADSAT